MNTANEFYILGALSGVYTWCIHILLHLRVKDSENVRSNYSPIATSANCPTHPTCQS